MARRIRSVRRMTAGSSPPSSVNVQSSGGSRLHGFHALCLGGLLPALRDERGNILAGTSHWVQGAGIQVAPGSIEIVLDRERHAPGDVAEALITFPEPVDTALRHFGRLVDDLETLLK